MCNARNATRLRIVRWESLSTWRMALPPWPIDCDDYVSRVPISTSEVLGVVGTGLVLAGYVPQIVHLVRERCTAGLSIPAFSVWCVASLLFLIHATLIRDVVFVGVQTVNLVAGGLIVAFCKKYQGEVCPFHCHAYARAIRGRRC